MAIVALPFSVLCIFIIPKPKEAIFIDEAAAAKEGHVVARKARFDWGGTFFQISAIALLVYGLTSSNTNGWYVPLSSHVDTGWLASELTCDLSRPLASF